MNAGARYGLLLGVFMMPFIIFSDDNLIANAVLWTVISVQLATGARPVWSRMALPFVTAAMVVGSLTGATFAVLLLRGFNPLALEHVLFVLPIVFTPALLLWVESRRNPDKWRAWREYMEDMSAIDVLLGRHIPRPRET